MAFKVTIKTSSGTLTLFGRYAHSFDAWGAGLDLCESVDARITVERDK